ncbi:MAG: cytochrome c biogenesis protein ResB [Deltaproteobacteria bacterium]|nr:cytochrome c biogenesis protein ResB [Deltaproteobacteria bacterium]
MNQKDSLFNKVWDFLGSRRMVIFLLTATSIYYVILFAFSLIASPQNAKNISNTYPFYLIYFLFFVNLTLCIYRWIPTLIYRIKNLRIKEVQVQGFVSNLSVDEISNILKNKGFKIAEKNECETYFIKNRFAYIGTVLFHLSLLSMLIGVVLTVNTRFVGTTPPLAKGETFWGMPNEYASIEINDPSRMPIISFAVDKIEADFWKGMQLFTRFQAFIRYPADIPQGEGYVEINTPQRFGSTYIKLAGMGYAFTYHVAGRDGYLHEKRLAKLNIFSPESEDSFYIIDTPYEVFVKVYPDFVFKDGRYWTKTFYPKNPLYYVKVIRNKFTIVERPLKPNEWMDIEGYKISFSMPEYWAQFNVVRDPGARIVFLGFILICIGITQRLLFYRQEILIKKQGEYVLVCCFAEYLQNSLENKIKTLAGIK